MKTDYYYHSPFKVDIIRIIHSVRIHTPNKIDTKIKSDVEKQIRHNRLTIYGQYDEKTETMIFSKSKCWGQDRFSKYFGRSNAEANMLEGKVILSTPVPTEQMSTPGKWFVERAKELSKIHLKGS